MRRLPIGIQTFEEIRSDNYFYVDKTKEAFELVTNYKYVFLFRPRRFGKSLFVDTLKCIFEGRKELFEGLNIYDKWNWEEKYPVIHISFAGDMENKENLLYTINGILASNQRRLEIESIESKLYSEYFKNLIEATYIKYKQKIVILVDEYDKPILDNVEDIERAKLIRETLKSLYTVIKDLDRYIRFAFFTGVTKFVKAGIFSGLNQLKDITLSEQFGNICGYRQQDVEELLKEYNADVDYDEVKEWYNGYYWLKDKLYNPFDIILFISENFNYEDYWFSTGTPTFLIKLLKLNNYHLPQLLNITMDKSSLDSYEIESIDFPILLFQAGYLTIQEVYEYKKEKSYRLGFPNKEVRKAFNTFILRELNKDSNASNNRILLDQAIENNDLEKFKEILTSIFSSISYNNYVNNNIYEYGGYYSTAIILYLQALGYNIIGEDVTSTGRIDLTMFQKNAIYIFEFKVGKGPDALEQLKTKNYHLKYMSDPRPIYLVGMHFDKRKKNIGKFSWIQIK